MYQEDIFNPNDPNDYESENDYSSRFPFFSNDAIVLTRRTTIGRKYRTRAYPYKIRVYPSGGFGYNIRDAETGAQYPNKVGTKDEDLFYKVILATGECVGSVSNTLFFCSPQHYESHMKCSVDSEKIANWTAKRDARLKELNQYGRVNYSGVTLVK